MATHQFESAKKLILHFTQKNHMNPESDIKGVMPGEHVFPSTPGPRQAWGARQPPLQDRESPHHMPLVPVRALLFQAVAPSRGLTSCDGCSPARLGT